MDRTPPFLSLEFHSRFLPSVLKARLSAAKRDSSGFSSAIELQLLMAASVTLVIIGLPGAVARSLFGWGSLLIGVTGVVVLVIHAVLTREGAPCFDAFLPGPFFLLTGIGISAGVFAGTLEHSPLTGVLVGAGGFAGGYLAGIASGLALQYLGWLAPPVNGLAWLALLGVGVVDLVVLSGAL